MDWQNKVIAVTGASGFIGQHLTQALLQLGVQVCTLVRDEDINILKVKRVRGDLRNYDDVERLYYEYTPDLIIHLGAVAPVGFGYRAPRQTIESNVLGTTNVLVGAMRHGNVPCIVASSDKAYGKPLDGPVTELTALNPYHPYDASKAAADLIALSFMRTYQLPVAVTRAANVYGPGDEHWNRIIPGCIKAALLDDIFIIRSDGTPIRDYIYIEDVVGAYLSLAIAILSDRSSSGVWNISAHERHSVLDILGLLEKILGRRIRYEITNTAKVETQELSVDGSKFSRDFGWSAYTPIEVGLEATAAWVAAWLGFDLGDV